MLKDREDFPLLNSKFSNLSKKGRGYNIQYYPRGISGMAGLRKIAIWSMSLSDERTVKELDLECIVNENRSPSIMTESDTSFDTQKNHIGVPPGNDLKAKLRIVSNLDISNSKQTAWNGACKPLDDHVLKSSKHTVSEKRDALADGYT